MKYAVAMFAIALSACADAGQGSDEYGVAGSPAVGLVTEALTRTSCNQGDDAQVASGQKAFIKDRLGSGWSISGGWKDEKWYGTGPGGRSVTVLRPVPPYDHYVTRTVIPSQAKSWQTTCHCSGLPPSGGYVSCKTYAN